IVVKRRTRMSRYVCLYVTVWYSRSLACSFLFFTDPAPTEIYTLSLHDALPISHRDVAARRAAARSVRDHREREVHRGPERSGQRSEEHTSELQSRFDLVCRLLLEKKKKK